MDMKCSIAGRFKLKLPSETGESGLYMIKSLEVHLKTRLQKVIGDGLRIYFFVKFKIIKVFENMVSYTLFWCVANSTMKERVMVSGPLLALDLHTFKTAKNNSTGCSKKQIKFLS